MPRVDLDDVEVYADRWSTEGKIRPTLLSLVAELRAARKVVEAARYPDDRPHLSLAVYAYDEVVS